MIKKIAITGPESTGKSTLSEKLANHFNTVWMPEYAREYIDNLERPYEKSDLLEIARGQIKGEDEMLKKASNFIFCDTELLVIKIWYQHKYGALHPLILDNYEHRNYDLYLLMNVDLPWKYDPQRENPHLRQYFFNWFEKELIKRGANYVIISGGFKDRFESAVKAVESVG